MRIYGSLVHTNYVYLIGKFDPSHSATFKVFIVFLIVQLEHEPCLLSILCVLCKNLVIFTFCETLNWILTHFVSSGLPSQINLPRSVNYSSRWLPPSPCLTITTLSLRNLESLSNYDTFCDNNCLLYIIWKILYLPYIKQILKKDLKNSIIHVFIY